MAARGAQVLIAATALIGLTACGSATAAGAAPPASTTAQGSSQQPVTGTSTPMGGSLCSDGQAADRVTVSGSAVPRQVTLHGATQVQAMVAALCALPAMPPGQHCPAAAADSELGPAGVRGGRAELPAGQRAGVELPRSNRTRGDPGVVPVIGVRPDAQRGGRRRGPTGPRHPPEQRADRAVTGLDRAGLDCPGLG